MSFFDSEIVQGEMKEISKLQDEIYAKVFSFSSMDADDKMEHVEMLEELLKKQKILYTRLSLSDDPEACLLYTSPSPRDRQKSRMPSSA